MNNKWFIISVIVAVVAIGASIFSGVIAVQYKVEKDVAYEQIEELTFTLGQKREEIDDLYQTIEDKQDELWQLSDDKNALTSEKNQLTSENLQITSENLQLTNQLASVTAERDQAIKDAEDRLAELELLYDVIPGEKLDIIQDFEDQIQEVRDELAEIDEYNQYLMNLQEEGVNRTTVIDETITNTGTKITVKGILINTGLNVIDSAIYFEAWNLLDEKCINITTNIKGDIGETTFLSPTEHKDIDSSLDYSPYVLSRYKVSVITGNKIYEITNP